MEERYLQMLPSELHPIIEEAEEKAACVIRVLPDENAAEFDNLMLGITPRGDLEATIFYRGTEISRCALIHEVLHIQRNLNEEIPCLKPLARRFYDQAWMLNDLLEHLIIIPEEQKHVETESRERWTGLCNELLWDVAGRWWAIPEITLKQNLFQLRAMRDIALPFWNSGQLDDLLTGARLWDTSMEFVATLKSKREQKVNLLRFAALEFQYDPAGFNIVRFDLSARPRTVALVRNLHSG